MARKCPCGSEPQYRSPPYVIIKLSDIWGAFTNFRSKQDAILDAIDRREKIIARGLKNQLEALGHQVGKVGPEALRDLLLTQDVASVINAQNPGLPGGGLSIANDAAWPIWYFCGRPPESFYSHTEWALGGIGPVYDKIFNDFVDGYWGKYCRCKRCELPPDCFPPFRGGQCPGMLYTVKFTVRSIQEDGSLVPSVYTPTYQVPGPIGPATFEWTSPSTFGGCRNYYFRYRWTHGPTSANPQGISFVSMGGSNVRVGHNPFTSSCYGGQASWIIVQQEVFPPPGTIDSCGDPPLPPHCFQPAPPPPPPRPPRVRYPIPFCECPPPPPPVRVVKLLPGPPGPKGPKGDKGDRGPRGFKGEKGAKGDKGDRGLRGLKGEKGDRGAKGETGRRGPLGYQGPKGDKGEKGAKGDRGERGQRGTAGPKGDRGATGPKGDKGPKGAPGLTGIKTILRFIPSTSDEKSSFTVSKSGTVYTIKLSLKMTDTELIKKIYAILGGDSWFTEGGAKPVLKLNPQGEIEAERLSLYPKGTESRSKSLKINSFVQLLADIAAVEHHRAGYHRFPAQVPKLLTKASEGDTKLYDAASWQEWLVLNLDALLGAYPIKMDFIDSAGQKRKLQFANAAEANAEILGLLLNIASDTDAIQASTMKAIIEAVAARTAATSAADYAKANASFLGYRLKESKRDMKISITPGANNLKKALEPSTAKGVKVAFNDKTDLQELLNRVLIASEIIKAVFYREYSPGDELPGDRIRKDRTGSNDESDQDWSEFIAAIENPPSNRQQTGAPKPDIRNLADKQESQE